MLSTKVPVGTQYFLQSSSHSPYKQTRGQRHTTGFSDPLTFTVAPFVFHRYLWSTSA